jgi:Lon protease-like protein
VADRIPLFPLGTVLYPGLVLPLHVFEDRYKLLVARLTEGGADAPEGFGVVAIRLGRESGVDGVSALHDVGCLAELRELTPMDDGRFDLVTTGSRRFRLLAVDTSEPYLQGDVEWLEEPEGDAAAVLARSVAARFLAYRAMLLGAPRGQTQVDLPRRPTVLSYAVAASMVLDLLDQQELLAAPDTTTRLRLELGLLRREAALLRQLPSLPGVELARQPAPPN